MKMLKTVQFKDLTQAEINVLEKRDAARAVVFDHDGKVGLLHVTKHNYHKLPGGGIYHGEDVVEALKRECLEELGCHVEVDGEIGSIIEYRDKYPLNQESFCYFARTVGDKGAPEFDQGEIDDGFSPMWVSLTDAIELLDKDVPDDDNGKFIQVRDLVFLKESRRLLDLSGKVY